MISDEEWEAMVDEEMEAEGVISEAEWMLWWGALTEEQKRDVADCVDQWREGSC